MLFEATEFDVSGWYNPALGLYTPLVAGYYTFSWRVCTEVLFTGTEALSTSFMKNGAQLKAGQICGPNAAYYPSSGGTVTAFANGTSDAFAIRMGTTKAGSIPILAGSAQTYFQCSRVG